MALQPKSTASAFLDALAGWYAIALKAVDGRRLVTVSFRGSAGAINKLDDCVEYLPKTGGEIVSDPFGEAHGIPGPSSDPPPAPSCGREFPGVSTRTIPPAPGSDWPAK